MLGYRVPLAACGERVRVAPEAGVGRAVPSIVLDAVAGAAYLSRL